MARKLSSKEEESADIIIRPDVESESLIAYHKAEFFIEAGVKATEEIIPQLRKIEKCR